MLRAIARGALTVPDLRTDTITTRALLADPNLTIAVPEVLQLRSQACAAAEETTLAEDELGALLRSILDALSPEELGRLPKPVWALLDFIAGSDDTKGTVSDRKT